MRTLVWSELVVQESEATCTGGASKVMMSGLTDDEKLRIQLNGPSHFDFTSLSLYFSVPDVCSAAAEEEEAEVEQTLSGWQRGNSVVFLTHISIKAAEPRNFLKSGHSWRKLPNTHTHTQPASRFSSLEKI